MARRSRIDPHSDDFEDRGRRIGRVPEGMVIWPSWEIYCEYRESYARDPNAGAWQLILEREPRLFSTALTQENFATWREGKINRIVEQPCRRLVRHLLDHGVFSVYGNGCGYGPKGVGFTHDILEFAVTGQSYFMYLRGWKTNPHFGFAARYGFSGAQVLSLDAQEHEEILLGYREILATGAQTQQPTRPRRSSRRVRGPENEGGGQPQN